MNERDNKLLETLVLPSVMRPGRYAGGEKNAVLKDPAACEVRMALAFPDVYEVGMSNLGFIIVYHLVNSIEWAYCERVFAPWPDMESGLLLSNIPLFSLETRAPLREFDVLGFSINYELSYTNILSILRLGGIPWRAAERGADFPLVLGGGCSTLNPEPLSDFFDLFALGEGEESVPEILGRYKECKAAGMEKSGILKELSQIGGVYVPSLYTPIYAAGGKFNGTSPAPGAPVRVEKRYVRDLDTCFFPESPVLPCIEAVHDRASVEVFRGCTRGCRFCQAGMIYRPMRERGPARLLNIARGLYSATGSEEISLLSFNATDYSHLEEALALLDDFATPRRVSISLPSSRLDSFTSEVGRRLRSVRPTGLTFAPEAGSQRLRDVINKQLTEEEIFGSLASALAAGWNRVKLYFMIGLPTETEADVEAIADLVNRISKLIKDRGGKRGKGEITVSVSNFVPKPHTPFQWTAMDSPESLAIKQSLLRRLITRKVKLDTHDVEVSMLEGVFARGDRRLSSVLEAAWNLGCRFDGWTEKFNYQGWLGAFASTGMDPISFSGREYGTDEALPWDRVSCGITAGFLERERERALDARTTAWCGNDGPCAACGLECLKEE